MSSSSGKRSSDRDDNQSSDPFTAFSRFVDERVSHLLQSIIGLPSSTEDANNWRPWVNLQKKDDHPWGWGYDERQRNAQERQQMEVPQDKAMGGISRCRTTECWNPATEARARVENPDYEEQLSLLEEQNKRRLHLARLAEAQSQTDAEWESLSEVARASLPTKEVERCSPGEAASRLDSFLCTSTYSPLYLETDPDLASMAGTWRAAFTDLLYETESNLQTLGDEHKFLRSRRLQPSIWKNLVLKKYWIIYTAAALRRRVDALYDSGRYHLILPAIEAHFNTARIEGRGYVDSFREQLTAVHPEYVEALCDAKKRQDIESVHILFPSHAAASRGTSMEADMYDNDEDEDEDEDFNDDDDDDDDDDDKEGDEADHHSTTELDMLELLAEAQTQVNLHNNEKNQHTSHSTNNSERPSIIGMLTTFERTRLPDGTLQTRRVLKKKFSDGTEEIEQSEEMTRSHSTSNAHTGDTHADVKTKSQSPPAKVKDNESSPGRPSGWFWK